MVQISVTKWISDTPSPMPSKPLWQPSFSTAALIIVTGETRVFCISFRIFAAALWQEDPKLFKVWTELPPHRLKEGGSDRAMIADTSALQVLLPLEESIGVRFDSIRLLAKALTRKNVPYNNLTM